MEKAEEKKLVEKIIKKDERAFLKLYKTYRKQVFSYVRRRLNDTHLSEELTQDIFFELIEGLRNFRGDSSLKNYIFSIAHNKVVDEINKKKIKKVLFSVLPENMVERLLTFVLEDEIDKRELRRKIKQVFDRLPNDYELILRLKYVEGEKVAGIAKRFSMSFKAAESLLFRARKAFVRIFNSL